MLATLGAVERRVDPMALRQRQVVAEVVLTDRLAVRQRGEAFGRVGPNRFQHPQSGGSTRFGAADQRLLATSRSSVATPAPVIVSAAGTPAPPVNTAKRAKHACSSASSRAWLQSSVARSVRWRAGASRTPVPSTMCRRAAISEGESSPQRAAGQLYR